jgi:hypothetical protein
LICPSARVLKSSSKKGRLEPCQTICDCFRVWLVQLIELLNCARQRMKYELKWYEGRDAKHKAECKSRVMNKMEEVDFRKAIGRVLSSQK